MDPNYEKLQRQVAELQRKMDAFYSSPTIAHDVDRSFVGRGFSKLQIFSGKTALNFTGEARFTIPGATKTSIALGSYDNPDDGAVGISMLQGYAANNYGSSSTRFDITNPAGTTFRYTYDGTGTNPNIDSTTVPVGSRMTIFSANFNPANTGTFMVTGSGANYFEVDNPTPGVAENDKTLGSAGSITGGAPNDTYEIYIVGVAAREVNYIVFLNPTPYTDDTI